VSPIANPVTVMPGLGPGPPPRPHHRPLSAGGEIERLETGELRAEGDPGASGFGAAVAGVSSTDAFAATWPLNTGTWPRQMSVLGTEPNCTASACSALMFSPPSMVPDVTSWPPFNSTPTRRWPSQSCRRPPSIVPELLALVPAVSSTPAPPTVPSPAAACPVDRNPWLVSAAPLGQKIRHPRHRYLSSDPPPVTPAALQRSD